MGKQLDLFSPLWVLDGSCAKTGSCKLSNIDIRVVQPQLKAWARPEVKKLAAGSAEAVEEEGTIDGGPTGMARS
jgi:hypothetical protein